VGGKGRAKGEKGRLLNGTPERISKTLYSACGLLYPLISAVYRVDYPLSIGSKPKGYRHRPLGRWLHVTGMHTAVIHIGWLYNGCCPSTYIFLATRSASGSETNKS